MSSAGTRTMQHIKWLDECDAESAPLVGGKAVSLGALAAHGLEVPPAFAITTEAYRTSLAAHGLEPRIAELLAGTGATSDNRAASEQITSLFEPGLMHAGVAREILDAYRRLGSGQPVAVAVRSSATADYAAEVSFAGHQETYFWIRGEDELLRHVVRCWASLFTPQAISYLSRFDVPADGLAMGVVVQEMVPADAAGVMTTLNPATGDATQIYVESAYGLREGVARGDVGSDRFWVDKQSLAVRADEINPKHQAHWFDPEAGEVQLVDVPAGDRERASLTSEEVRAIAEHGRRVEDAFGAPMDIEWAIVGTGIPRRIALVQARPETVWSQRARVPTSDDVGAAAAGDDWDPLHLPGAPELHWSRDNVGEAIPGVASPLGWSIWGSVGDRETREVAYRLGAMSRRERDSSTPDREIMHIFYGRAAIQIEYVATLGDRLPGTTGQDAVKGLLGEVPEDMSFRPTNRRYPIIAWRLPWVFVTSPRRVRRLAAETDSWWQAQIKALPARDLAASRATFQDAVGRFEQALTIHTVCLLSVVQPLYQALAELIETAGVGELAVLSGSGGAEMAIVSDLWRASRGEIDLDEVVCNHGFHGPMEGEISSRVWREDRSSLERVLKDYAARPESAAPLHREAAARQLRPKQQREVLAALPRARRPAARALLALAASRILLRGIGKRAFLQSLDVVRASARRMGECLVAERRLADQDDVFYLTLDELTGTLPDDVQELVARRRQRRRDYERLSIPESWTGTPAAVPLDAGDADAEGDVVSGIGVSSGIVEGVARVVTDPGFTEVLTDEVLVASTTDPSWSSIMFVSSALVVDIGGALSHAAVVARELGLPCVVNTRNGTRTIRTGDRVRVDGNAGTVEILRRASSDKTEGPGELITERGAASRKDAPPA
jgi:rifampicin phosphotransferase